MNWKKTYKKVGEYAIHMNMTEKSCNVQVVFLKVSFFYQDSQEFFLARFTGNSIFTIYQLLTNFNEYYPGIPSEGDIKEINEGWKRNAWGSFGENTANNILFQAMKPADHVAMKSGQQSN